MENRDIQAELDLLLAGRLLFGFLDCEKCIEWAISLTQKGYKADSLNTLTSQDVTNYYDVSNCFEKLIGELGLIKKEDSKELFQIFISDVAQGVIDGRVEPMKGLSVMDAIGSIEADYSGDMIDQFSYLAYDASMLDGHPSFYSGLTPENIEEVIKDEMRMLLYAPMYPLGRVIDLIYCMECGDFTHWICNETDPVSNPDLRVCDKCGLQQYLAWYRVADRKQMLQLLDNDCMTLLDKKMNAEIKSLI